MANRVCLGQRTTGEFGLWVSKPGFNVLTASFYDMLFSTDMSAAQVIHRGEVTTPTNVSSLTFTIPNFGFRPALVFGVEIGASTNVFASKFNRITYNSNTSVTLSHPNSSWTVTGSSTNTVIPYVVLNQELY